MCPGGIDGARTYTISAHAKLRLLNRNPAHESMQESLGATIRSGSRFAVDSRFRPRTDDVSLLLAQVGQSVLRHQECRANIAADVLIEFIDGSVIGFCVNQKDAGVIDQHI